MLQYSFSSTYMKTMLMSPQAASCSPRWDLRAATVHGTGPPWQAASQSYQQCWTSTWHWLAPAFMAAHITMPSNLHFKAWDGLVQMPEDAREVFVSASLWATKGQYPHQPMATTFKQLTMPGLCTHTWLWRSVREPCWACSIPQFTPWCQVNALLTWPQKDSHLRRVIMDLS